MILPIMGDRVIDEFGLRGFELTLFTFEYSVQVHGPDSLCLVLVERRIVERHVYSAAESFVKCSDPISC